MNPHTLSIVCDPVTHAPLHLKAEPSSGSTTHEFLINTKSGEKFSVQDDIANFLENRTISGLNKKYQGLYDLFAPFYDIANRTSRFLIGQSSSEQERRRKYLGELEIKKGDKVLEVSIGTGGNLRVLPENAHYFGLDISRGMLKRCQKNLQRRNMTAELFLGEAEHLPFRDNSFDSVFHVGGINFFNDRAKAVKEMIRVAKAGTKIVIVDETEKEAKLENAYLAQGHFTRTEPKLFQLL